jgi:hypothetical protein
MLAGVIAASVSGPTGLEAQAFDSLGRPRPLTPLGPAPRDSSRHIIIHCGSGVSVAYRIIGADGQLLYMSSADTTSSARAAWEPADAASLGGVEPSQIENLEVMKAAAAEKTYGKPYVNGLIIVTLSRKGTEAWVNAAHARATKP